MPSMPRKKLIKKICLLSHEIGKEITEKQLLDGIYDADLETVDEPEFLKDIYRSLLKRWQNHQLPMTSMDEDI